MKRLKPTTPGQRGAVITSFKEVITTRKPYKALTRGLGRKRAGRNNKGIITMRHRGGGHKKKFRDIDFTNMKKGISAKVDSVEYDPYRSAFISLVTYKDGEKRYVLNTDGVKKGDTISYEEQADIKKGNRLALKNIPIGTSVHSVEIQPGGKACLVRSAGSSAKIIAQDENHTHIKLPSKEVRKMPSEGFATIGVVSNTTHRLRNHGKAGRRRNMGRRPVVRGSAMGSHDHPHGGGEGKGGRGRRRAVSKWGKPTGKGQKTRNPKKHSNVFIISRKKKN